MVDRMNQIPTSPRQVSDDEIDLREIFVAVWSGKLTVLAFTFIVSIIVVLLAISLPNEYRSEALLSPVNQEGGLSGLASNLGGLASLAGVNLNKGDGDNKTILAIETLKSRRFFKEFNERHNILPSLMAATEWDANTNQLIFDESLYNPATMTWVIQEDSNKSKVPSIQEAHKQFLERLIISQDDDTGFVRVSFEFYSPYIAKEWVDKLVFDINETIKKRDVAQAERSIAYLNEQIQITQLTELKTGFFEMIQSQTETMMLANASKEYLFQTLDPAIVPELKSKPKRALMCVLGAMLGGILGIIFVLVRHFIKR